MAKSIVKEWPHLKEQFGKGYEGWLASICEALKRVRSTLELSTKIPRTLNFSEEPLDGEDERSMQLLISQMQKEM